MIDDIATQKQDEKRSCEICGRIDRRIEGGERICSRCYSWARLSYCPSCEVPQRGKKMRLCWSCSERWKTRVANGKFLPLDEGENPRCVYPDCLACPMPDCMFDNSTLYVMGISLQKETPFTCIRCGAEVKNVLSNYCGKCNAARHNEEERRAALLYGDRKRRKNNGKN